MPPKNNIYIHIRKEKYKFQWDYGSHGNLEMSGIYNLPGPEVRLQNSLLKRLSRWCIVPAIAEEVQPAKGSDENSSPRQSVRSCTSITVWFKLTSKQDKRTIRSADRTRATFFVCVDILNKHDSDIKAKSVTLISYNKISITVINLEDML